MWWENQGTYQCDHGHSDHNLTINMVTILGIYLECWKAQLSGQEKRMQLLTFTGWLCNFE